MRGFLKLIFFSMLKEHSRTTIGKHSSFFSDASVTP